MELHNNIPNTTIHLDRLKAFWVDRDASLYGKTYKGGLCVYINREWCVNSVIITSRCLPITKFIMLCCHPFYRPRKCTTVITVAVYIPSGGNATKAQHKLYRAVSKLQTTHPDRFFLVAGDFNHVNLNITFPKFYQQVNFPTSGENQLRRLGLH